MSRANNIQAAGFNSEHIGWKYYNQIRKKAVEREFSWSGLILSLSIAFFIVIFSAQCLSLAYKSMAKNDNYQYYQPSFSSQPSQSVQAAQGRLDSSDPPIRCLPTMGQENFKFYQLEDVNYTNWRNDKIRFVQIVVA